MARRDRHRKWTWSYYDSTMLDVKVDRAEPTPLHDQVAGEIRRAIADGEALPGERLPPARDMAAVLGSTRTPCSGRCDCCATRVCLSSAEAAASTYGTPPAQRGPGQSQRTDSIRPSARLPSRRAGGNDPRPVALSPLPPATHTIRVVRTVRSSRCRMPSGPSLSSRVSSVARSSAVSLPSRPDRMRRSVASA